ncbi:hypothetical protein B0J14DRAFT_564248 [Halenospora varia]|nr:hypothetical protein B0J14DRAFT_564248 [Halenospora varia]
MATIESLRPPASAASSSEDVYDPDNVGLHDSPLLTPMKLNLQPLPSPTPFPLPQTTPESTPRPPGRKGSIRSNNGRRQGDAVLVSFMGGGKRPDIARKAGNEPLGSDDEDVEDFVEGTEVTVEKEGIDLTTLAADASRAHKAKTAQGSSSQPAQTISTIKISTPVSDVHYAIGDQINGVKSATITPIAAPNLDGSHSRPSPVPAVKPEIKASDTSELPPIRQVLHNRVSQIASELVQSLSHRSLTSLGLGLCGSRRHAVLLVRPKSRGWLLNIAARRLIRGVNLRYPDAQCNQQKRQRPSSDERANPKSGQAALHARELTPHLEIRKVKCDESRPVCNRCTRFGTHQNCVYLSPPERKPKLIPRKKVVPLRPRLTDIAPPRPLRPRLTDIAPPRPGVPALHLQTLSASIPGGEAERRYFKLFHDSLAGDFDGWFETPFWTRLMPQQCHHEPTIRHAILALSAIYSFRASRIEGKPTSDEHLKFALVQQNKAIASLQKHMSSKNPQIRLILIASFLFACVESFHDNLNTAARQIYSGLAILKYWQEERKKNRKEDLAAIDSDVRDALGRFELQVRSYLAMNPLFHDPTLDAAEEEPWKLPSQFVTVKQAFMYASRLSNDFLRYLRQSPRYMDGEVNLESFEHERGNMELQINQWKELYLKLFQTIKADPTIDAQIHLASIHLITCLKTFEIMFLTSITKNECVFDGFTEQFAQIVSWCRFLMEKDQEIRRSGGMSTNLRAQFGMGMIMPLYYTATRCRNFTVRRDAVAILKDFPSKNGMWDSLITAKVAEWVIEREEGSNGQRLIPEECRVRASTLKMNLQKNGIYVECIQAQRFIKETIAWEQ